MFVDEAVVTSSLDLTSPSAHFLSPRPHTIHHTPTITTGRLSVIMNLQRPLLRTRERSIRWSSVTDANCIDLTIDEYDIPALGQKETTGKAADSNDEIRSLSLIRQNLANLTEAERAVLLVMLEKQVAAHFS